MAQAESELARTRIELTADPGTFAEKFTDLRPSDRLGFVDKEPYSEKIEKAQKKTGQNDACIAGTCEIEGIPVVLTPPQLADAARWEGAMISSTSRLLLPVDELYVPQPGACAEEADRVRRFDNGDGSLAARLRALVAEEVEAHSSALRE